MPNISRFYTGKVLNGFQCPWCGTKSRGMVFQNRIRWMVRMYCGHMKTLGYTAPVDYLKKQGLANPQLEIDPRIKEQESHAQDLAMREARERAEYEAHKQKSTLKSKYITL